MACGLTASFARTAPRGIVTAQPSQFRALRKLLASADVRVKAAAAWAVAALGSNNSDNLRQFMAYVHSPTTRLATWLV